MTGRLRSGWVACCLATMFCAVSPRWVAASESVQASKPSATPTGIIILGGGLAEFRKNKQSGQPPSGVAQRISSGIALWRQFPSATLVYAGAEPPPGPLGVLLAEGVPAGSLVIEDRARNTAESAVFAARILRPTPEQTWLLVTSAYHMQRAIQCFREAGFRVEPVEVERESGSESDPRAFHEWAGRLSYNLLGLCKPA